MTTAIVWFRRDLRLADNPALTAALAAHERVLPIYIHAPAEQGEWAEGGASRWWLHHALAALQTQWRRHHGQLQLFQGDSLAVLRQLIHASGASAVYWNRCYEPLMIERDTRIKQALRAEGVAVHSTPGGLLCEPWQIATGQGEPYRVFTPYWRKLRTQWDEHAPLPVPQPLRCHDLGQGVPLEQLALLPTRPDWAGGLRQHWTPGEQGAQELLEVFLDDALGHYQEGRDLPARHGTSRLSPHLHFGEITPRQIRHAIAQRAAKGTRGATLDAEPYLRQLGWRDFAHHLLYHFPGTARDNFNPRFDGFAWAATNEVLLERWQRGRTGIPLVDAGMRELWHTGWMHNRVRMVTASFLTKNLRQHWHHGEDWFWDTLVDADQANNAMGWQWVAGCGADAAPYFRVFNPVSQASKFDPGAAYLRRWLPELAQAEADLFEPWKTPAAARRAGYPAPLVDLAASREQALAAYQKLRG